MHNAEYPDSPSPTPSLQMDGLSSTSRVDNNNLQSPPIYDSVKAYHEKMDLPQFTTRAVVCGLGIGLLSCFSNCYFGLQTGWVSMMSLPSSLVGFSVFKAFESHLSFPFTEPENVLVQTVAVATGTMPLAAGLVGIIPALEKFLTADEGGPLNFSSGQLIIWSFGVAFFGVFFAIPLRKHVIIREKLRFPSGHATATMISLLHEKGQSTSDSVSKSSWVLKIQTLIFSFIISSGYTVISYFFPILRALPVFDWMTLNHVQLSKDWLWDIQLSPAYIGQGIIMGLPTTLSMLLGCLIGWAFLSPLAKNMGWAPGDVSDWNDGSKGWLIWVSLSVMLADCIVSLFVLLVKTLIDFWLERTHKDVSTYDPIDYEDEHSSMEIERCEGTVHEVEMIELSGKEIDASETHIVTNNMAMVGLFLSSLLCIGCVKIVFPYVPLYSTICAIILALFLSILGVRALGETDLNPVSGIGKISQLLFAFIVPRSNPHSIIINLVAGGIAEAGAQQAGDLMQDLKTGHLLAASPRAQFYGQLIGSFFSVIVSPLIYKLYDSIYEIPGDLFHIPTAHVWIDCSRLVNGEGLPSHVEYPSIILASIFGFISLLKALRVRGHKYLPSGLAAAVGMYNVPQFTIARTIGGFIAWWWARHCRRRNDLNSPVLAVILASGFVLGEGVFSILNLIMAAGNVPHF